MEFGIKIAFSSLTQFAKYPRVNLRCPVCTSRKNPCSSLCHTWEYFTTDLHLLQNNLAAIFVQCLKKWSGRVAMMARSVLVVTFLMIYPQYSDLLLKSIIYLMLLVAFVALDPSETQGILHSSKTVFFLLVSYSSFVLSCLFSFLIVSGFLSISGWSTFYVMVMVILMPPALAVLSYWIDWLCFGQESAGTPSYFVPHCERNTVFSNEYSVCVKPPSQSQSQYKWK